MLDICGLCAIFADVAFGVTLGARADNFPENFDFPGNLKNSREPLGMKNFGKFPGIPGRDFPSTSPNLEPLVWLEDLGVP